MCTCTQTSNHMIHVYTIPASPPVCKYTQYITSYTMKEFGIRKICMHVHFVYMYTCTFESHLRQLIFSRKSDCLGCAVLLCLVCLFDLACFFLSSFSSLKNMYMYIY